MKLPSFIAVVKRQRGNTHRKKKDGFECKIKGLLETTTVLLLLKFFCLIEELQKVQSRVSCDLVTFRIVTFYLLCNNLSRVVLFVQTGSVEVLVFP